MKNSLDKTGMTTGHSISITKESNMYIEETKRKQMKEEYEMGKDVACIASLHSLTCAEVISVLEIEEEE